MRQTVKRLAIRVEVQRVELHRLTNQVADLAESADARFDAVDRRFDALEASLIKNIDDGQAAIVSVLQQLLRR